MDISRQTLQLKKALSESCYTVAITGAVISFWALAKWGLSQLTLESDLNLNILEIGCGGGANVGRLYILNYLLKLPTPFGVMNLENSIL
ncbi:MAG: hypothetical protein LUE16_03190 [Lachnospiraceae bacterium]|nr:hypothetical protein [Lachnospiraceae bacterium]